MSVKNYLNYIKRRLFGWRNILFFMIILFLFLIIFACITMINFSYNFQENNKKYLLNMRTLIVYGENEEIIDQIEHVTTNVSTRFYYGFSTKAEEFDDNNYAGEIDILPLLNNEDVKIVSGRTLENNNEAICPDTFYPYSLYNEHKIMEINPTLYLQRKDILGKSFTIISRNENISDKLVKIVGTYDSSKTLDTANTCYISYDDYDELASLYEGKTVGTYADGTIVEEMFEYTGRMVRVDKYINVDVVKKELEEKGFSVFDAYVPDQQILDYMIYIPIFVSLIIIILCINLIHSFVTKKINYRLKNYGILKACGYQDKTIIKMDLCENLIIIMGAFIFSIIIYSILLGVVVKKYLIEFTYNNYFVEVPYLGIIIITLLLIFILYFFYKKYIKKCLKKNIAYLLKG